MSNIAWFGEDMLGRVTDLVEEYGVDVRLVYSLWGLVHYVVRAQRRGAVGTPLLQTLLQTTRRAQP